MRRLIFASNNKHKLVEVRAALDGIAEVVSLAEAGLEGEIPETADTLQGNALQKAEWVVDQIKVKSYELSVDGVFADDTGLEVDALNGAPGVYSARYAGEHCSFDDNINKLLAALDGQSNRKADFRTVICLIEGLPACGGNPENPGNRLSKISKDFDNPGESWKSNNNLQDLQDFAKREISIRYFEGRVDGQILTERHSNGEGFGYDPVFMPDRFAVSFAEMPLEVKNSISHRGLAVEKLAAYLKPLS